MPQQAAGQFGRAGLRPRAEAADRVEPHFASEAPPTAADIEAEIRRFTQGGELSTPPAPPAPVDAASQAQEAVEQARQRWEAEERQRLADAEAAWEARNRNRTATARMTVQRAEATMEELHRQLAQAQKALDEKDAEIAQAWAACEQERTRRNSPAEAQQQRATRALQSGQRLKMLFHVTREFAWTALVVALAILAAQRAAPLAVGVWKQELGPNGHLKPLFQEAAGFRLSPAKASPIWTVSAPIANLRTRPSPGAPVLMVLPLNAAVTPVATHGKWTFVRVGEGAAAQQGWVQASALRSPKP